MTRYLESRRRFLRSLGLTAGARVLAPIALGLHRRAWGDPAAAAPAKKIVFLTMGAGLPDAQLGVDLRQSDTQWSLSPALSALAPWKQKMAIVTGLNLNSVPGRQHSAGYGFLSCVDVTGAAADDPAAMPSVQTLDQTLGAALSAGTSMNTVLFGVDRDQSKVTNQSMYAAGPNQPVPYPARASTMFEQLFPNASENQNVTIADTRVMSRLRSDIKRVQAGLAGQDRVLFDGYLESLEAFDRRRSGLTCVAPNAPSADRGVVPEFPVMLTMAAMALRCGVTNVVAGNIGAGNSHYNFPVFVGPHVGTVFEQYGGIGDFGHDPLYPQAREILWTWVAQQVAVFLQQLQAPLPGGGSLLDNTVVVLTSDSGPDHHNGPSQRFVIVGDLGGRLRCDGRFVSIPFDDDWWDPLPPDKRSTNQVYTALATALGVPMDSLGNTQRGGTSAPMPELLAS